MVVAKIAGLTPQTIFSVWLERQKRCRRVENLTDDELAEVSAGLEAVKVAMTPATPTQAAAALARVALVCKHAQGDPQDREARAALYLKYLSEYPPDALEAAADEWIRTSAWYPAISELSALCKIFTGERKNLQAWMEAAQRHAVERKRKRESLIARGYDPESGEPLSRPSAEDMHRIRAEAEKAFRRVSGQRVESTPENKPVSRRAPVLVPLPDEERERLLNRISRGSG